MSMSWNLKISTKITKKDKFSSLKPTLGDRGDRGQKIMFGYTVKSSRLIFGILRYLKIMMNLKNYFLQNVKIQFPSKVIKISLSEIWYDLSKISRQRWHFDGRGIYLFTRGYRFMGVYQPSFDTLKICIPAYDMKLKLYR